MFEVYGKYSKAKIFTDNIEEGAVAQIIEVCNQPFVEDCKIAIMPDVHAGKGCTIGTTLEIKDKVVPNLVGVDIGCGMLCIRLDEKEIDFVKLDKVIREKVPCGQNIRSKISKFAKLNEINLSDLKCLNKINLDRAEKSIGTLGGGNHFIEINKDSEGYLYLVIHTGSRYLGKQVAEYYQNKAISNLTDNREEKQRLIAKLKAENKEKNIPEELKKLKAPKIANHLAYLEGEDLKDYLHDINIVQKYSNQNRMTIALEIMLGMGWSLIKDSYFTTIHNYIDLENNILRKGAISAQKDEKVIIPINMRDGSIIAIGKGNADWNYSAPHGAGRIYSRRVAKEKLKLEDFEKSMEGIWSSSICQSTLDESPMVYKPIDEIISNIKDTATVTDIIKPMYNFKAN